MTYVLKCRDLGFDCDAVVKAETDEMLIQTVADHAREEHDMDPVPVEIVDRIHQVQYEE